MREKELAVKISELVGGPGNVNQVTHCATRLRFVVKDNSKVQKDQLSATKGVVQVVESGGQTQIVIGPGVGDVYLALIKEPGWETATGSSSAVKEKQGFVDWLFGLLSGTFQPLLMPLIGSSMLLMIYGLGNQFTWFDPDDPGVFWSVLHAACNAFFYFMPILIAATATRRLGGTPYLGATIAAALLHPSFMGLGGPGDVVNFLGAPLYLFGYANSVFPAILIAIALSYLEPLLRKALPKNLHLVLIPTISIALLVPAAILVIGPIGVMLGNGLVWVIATVNDFSSLLLGIVFGATFIFFVIFGLHWALVPIQLLNIAAGGDPLMPISSAYNFAVWGLALAVFLKAKKGSDVKELAGAGAVSGLIAGISEPMLYGVILRFKRIIPMIIASAAVGGGIIGAFGVKADAFAFASLLTIPLMQPMVGYIVGIAVSFVMMFTMVMVFGYESKNEAAAVTSVEEDMAAPAPAASAESTGPIMLRSPMTGKVIPLAEVPDPVFSSGRLGRGIAILPESGHVVAPCDATVLLAPASGHAIGLRCVGGVDILIHIGIDTVNLGGKGFTTHVQAKQEVGAGDPLVDVDLEIIAQAGYSAATPIVATSKVAAIEELASGAIGAGDELVRVVPSAEVSSK
ncbi:glucose PTS transporter subunit IIA [Actinomycetaceae bacterium L2_0104]